MNRIATQPPSVSSQARLPLAFPKEIRIPALVDQESFRRWARSPDFPERGRFSYLNGELWVDLSMEQLFSHNRVKTTFTVVVGGLIDAGGMGYFFSDGTLLSHPVGVSTEPDGTFVCWGAVRDGRVRLVEGAEEGYVELEGTPDMVLEIVSPTSERKDTEILRELYWRAGILEYWLVDAQGPSLRFDILRRTPRRYVATRKQGGWLRSVVFGRSFRLTQGTDPLGHPQYTLEVQA